MVFRKLNLNFIICGISIAFISCAKFNPENQIYFIQDKSADILFQGLNEDAIKNMNIKLLDTIIIVDEKFNRNKYYYKLKNYSNLEYVVDIREIDYEKSIKEDTCQINFFKLSNCKVLVNNKKIRVKLFYKEEDCFSWATYNSELIIITDKYGIIHRQAKNGTQSKLWNDDIENEINDIIEITMSDKKYKTYKSILLD